MTTPEQQVDPNSTPQAQQAAQAQVENLPPIKLAFILDGEIADILHTDDRLAAIFTSEPLILDITDRVNNETIGVGYLYNAETNTFSENPNAQTLPPGPGPIA